MDQSSRVHRSGRSFITEEWEGLHTRSQDTRRTRGTQASRGRGRPNLARARSSVPTTTDIVGSSSNRTNISNNLITPPTTPTGRSGGGLHGASISTPLTSPNAHTNTSRKSPKRSPVLPRSFSNGSPLHPSRHSSSTSSSSSRSQSPPPAGYDCLQRMAGSPLKRARTDLSWLDEIHHQQEQPMPIRRRSLSRRSPSSPGTTAILMRGGGGSSSSQSFPPKLLRAASYNGLDRYVEHHHHTTRSLKRPTSPQMELRAISDLPVSKMEPNPFIAIAEPKREAVETIDPYDFDHLPRARMDHLTGEVEDLKIC
ncbi:hypothetical protein INT44_003299 [Umbelopsis vinacea]|uniref:Uncharacterized protein n=1 Tax=Umbelopsis vinacea TaxID=44442 RepID=A0A8H7UIF8_9FUNG|nr:hypothetical protein INT44_003299 [Umbelopsis vinacea]KAI9288275.1 hypothetical protein BC943DRAFT_318126 [Umbelopsis sp. AD052]